MKRSRWSPSGQRPKYTYRSLTVRRCVSGVGFVGIDVGQRGGISLRRYRVEKRGSMYKHAPAKHVQGNVDW